MGLGDFFNKAWNYVAAGATKVVSSVKDAASAVYNGVKGVAKKVGDMAGTVYSKGETAVVAVYNDVIKRPLDAVSKGVEGIGSMLGSPLTWLAVGVGAIVVLPMVLKR